jgi:hypothetical protein
MTRMTVGMACILALALAPACWGAQDIAQGPAEDVAESGQQAGEAVGRVSEVAFYGWLTGVNAEVGIGPLEIAVDSSFSDNLDNLDLGVMAYYETWVGESGFYLDLIHARLSDALLPLGPISVEYDATQTFLEAGALLRRGTPERPVDVIVGARYTDQQSDYRLTTGMSGSRSQHWVDPIVGLRCRGPVSDKWTYSVRGDVGGFGIGSDFTWQVEGSFRYRTNPESALIIGYRYKDTHYEDADFTYSGTLRGPLVGFAFEM